MEYFPVLSQELTSIGLCSSGYIYGPPRKNKLKAGKSAEKIAIIPHGHTFPHTFLPVFRPLLLPTSASIFLSGLSYLGTGK